MRSNSFLVKSLLFSQLMVFSSLPGALAQKADIISPTKQLKVAGKVTDEKGMAMPGVSIQVKGGNAIAATDNTGSFSVVVPEGTVLRFTSTGFAM